MIGLDMPANLSQAFAKIDFAKIKAAVEDYGPALRVVRDTWDKATIQEIAEGKLFVSDDLLNDALQKEISGEDAPVTALTLKSHENGRLDITADTKKIGPVELSGTIEEFVHDGDTSLMRYHVRSKNIPQHGLMSWIFSRVSLSMAQRMVGHFDLPENLPVTVKRNVVTVDYSQVLAASDFGKTELYGHRLLDMVEIKSATPKDGGILFETELHVPDDVKKALVRLAREKARDVAGTDESAVEQETTAE